jgi:hypothetical protein
MTERLIDVAAIAACYGTSLKSIYRYVAAGKLGQVKKTCNGMRLRQDAVEAFFKRPFTPPPAPTKSDTAKILAAPYTVADTLLLWRSGAETRDKDWVEHLRKHKVDLAPPPLEENFRSTLASPHLTRQQVITLIERAVELRDRNWNAWRDNRDGGPAPLQIDNLDHLATHESSPKYIPNPVKWSNK